MSTTSPLPIRCDDEERRALIQAHDTLQGIDYLEVVTAPPADNQKLLELHFLANTTADGERSLEALLDALAAQNGVEIIGGRSREEYRC
jgi:hypothetical protein